ncbi:hypothetical protein V7x_34340 [Crateriforma conspicua]|uniref:Uncharacterized protein n=1 Tax=Crateriforma conspicua TaxID=2527996 RepID=A0A5C6FMG6_9PLAN|nr:hypothetical protein [Crateriforma conspicua]TWU61746.1 hypothetical protein V7x_34340 [Crateriforma conspicua]
MFCSSRHSWIRCIVPALVLPLVVLPALAVAADGRAEVDAVETPQVADAELTIQATVVSDLPHGVVLAQGGQQNGYALGFDYGRPVFSIRRDGSVTEVAGRQVVIGRVDLTINWGAENVTIQVLGGEKVQAKSPGLLSRQPGEPLSIGRDRGTAVGSDWDPQEFRGKVVSWDVMVGKVAGEQVDGGQEEEKVTEEQVDGEQVGGGQGDEGEEAMEESAEESGSGNPSPEDPSPEDPSPEDPSPEDPSPENPSPENPSPENPSPENPSPENPSPENPSPENPSPENPSPENP